MPCLTGYWKRTTARRGIPSLSFRMYRSTTTICRRRLSPHMAKRLNVGEARLYSVATFYENFSLEPKGKYVIKVCDGTACHVRKSIPILERLRNELGLSESKHTTDDLMFTLDTVSCLGACGLAPVLTVNDTVHPSMTPDKASELIAGLRNKED